MDKQEEEVEEGKMKRIAIMEKRIRDRLSPSVLRILNESDQHGSVPKGSETHFKILVVSDEFKKTKTPLEKHRLVNDLFKEELALGVKGGGIHALSIVAKTPEQWEKMEDGSIPDAFGVPSPKCMGGSKFDTKKQ